MDWKEKYADRIMSAEEAVANVKSGDRVVLGHACGEPVALSDALVAEAEKLDLHNVEIVHMVAMGKAGYCAPEMAERFRHNAIFVGGSTRKAVEEGRGDLTPCFFHEVPALWDEALPVDVALISVSTPDEHGYCSFGVSCDYTKSAAEKAKLVIAQINDCMPRVLGDNFIHLDDIDVMVCEDQPLIELAPPNIGEVEKAIGENVASLIKDGDCLQLGIGAIPDAVLLFLKEKKDLGIHTEMFSDGVVELINAGVITNAAKNVDKGICVSNFLMGTKKLYDFVDDNPMVALRPVDNVNHPMVICQNDNVVSINSCVEVDLMGQVASESIGLKQISGVGGQVDFVRGANMSKGGRSIMAMPATARKGASSKIVPFLTHGAAVTTCRCDADYIVTEYGIAKMQGNTLRERARQLINIAAPQFREELIEEFKARFHCDFE